MDTRETDYEFLHCRATPTSCTVHAIRFYKRPTGSDPGSFLDFIISTYALHHVEDEENISLIENLRNCAGVIEISGT